MNDKSLKISGLFVAGIIIIVSFVYAVNVQPVVFGNDITFFPSNDDNYSYDLMSFRSYEEFSNFLYNCSRISYNYGTSEALEFKLGNIRVMNSDASLDSHLVDIDYSQTNIQVQGVDEPDTVKTDGTYIYIVSGQKVYIILARPAEDAKILSNITVDFTITDIFVNGDILVIFGNSYNHDYLVEVEIDGGDEPQIGLPVPWYSTSSTNINIYNISDRENSELKREIQVGGNYYNARMIGDYIYVITNQWSNQLIPYYEGNNTVIPMIKINGELKRIPLSDICCIDVPSSSYTLTHIISVNIKDDEGEVVDKIYTLGDTQTMYVSKNNIYITYQRTRDDYFAMQQIIDEVVMPILPEKIKNDIEVARNFDIDEYNKNQIVQWLLDSFYNTLTSEERNNIETEIQMRIYRTVIHKISVNEGLIEYMCNGSVPGRTLNQFSMDEHNGFFRIATQIDDWWWNSNIEKCTNIYILDENLERISEIENIAPGENMHSARFMGNRVYLVTFKKVDPFFVIDLTDPYNPEILGELKIPGYSDYLHPFDENHIIGVGKDTDDQGSFAWYQGLKIAIFDVTDPKNPIELTKTIIGDRGTDSPVLYDHKAFLFDKEKGLLVLPVSLYVISDEIKEQQQGSTGWTYGEFEFQGAYVYKVSLENGFEYQGRITHRDHEESTQEDYYWSDWSSYNVERSLFINDVLYTISDKLIKMNNLGDLSEINAFELE